MGQVRPQPTQDDLDYLAANPTVAPKFKSRFGFIPPSQEDWDYLRANPQSEAKFKAHFGDVEKPTSAMSTGEYAVDAAKFLGGRLANAAISVPGLPADLVGLQLAGMDWLAGNKTRTANPLEAISGHTIRDAAHDYGSQALNAAGFKTTPEDLTPREPQGPGEKFAGNVADLVGYGAGPGALTKQTLTSAATGGAGLTAAQALAPDNPLVHVAGAILGHRGPAIAGAASKRILRGSGPGVSQDLLAANKRLESSTGVDADLMPGQVAGDYGFQQILDALVARSPGGQPGVLRANESQAKLLDEAISQTAANPTGKLNTGTPTRDGVGRKVQEDFEKAAEKFRATQKKVEDGFQRVIGEQTRIPMSKTEQIIADMRAKLASDPKVAALIEDSYIAKVAAALEESGGTLSYTAARSLKTDAGELLPKSSLLGDVKATQVKRLYGALAEDIGGAAKSRGIGSQWERYNKWATATYARSEKIFDRLVKNRELYPEKTAKAFMGQDATAMRIAMKNLTPEGRSMAAGQFLIDLAKSKAAGAAAEDVSTSYVKFLGNLIEAKRNGTFQAMFGAPEFKPLRDTVDDLDRVSKAAMRANKVSHDVSGATVVRGVAGFEMLRQLVVGDPGVAALIAMGAFVGPAVAGKLMRSKSYLNWLAAARKPGAETRALVQRLTMIAARDRDPEIREAIKEFIPAYMRAQSELQGQAQEQPDAPKFTQPYPEAPGGYPYR